MDRVRPAPAQSLPVFRARDLTATDGGNIGEPLSFAADLLLDDVYEMPPDTARQRLTVLPGHDGSFRIDADSAIGTPGAILHVDSALSLMSPDGATHEAILLVEADDDGAAADIYLLPLGPLSPRTGYHLVGIDTDTPLKKFAQVACVSFARGTHITLASGEQRLIEDLAVGDRVLTRDDGAQEIRWIGLSTVRASGDMAPIRIDAGTLNNARDLVVSPDHRLFIYQRSDELGAGRSELLVKARHLVNGLTVTRQQGGFVDYFQLLFDRHQIIYAEGIAAETMLIDSRTRPALPDALAQTLGMVIPGHSDLPHAGLDISEALINRPDAADILRKASTR